MSKMIAHFEYEIGEIVYHKTAMHCKGHRPKAFIVIGRLAEECGAGVQKHYILQDRVQVTEIALTREEPSYRPTTQEEIDDDQRPWKSMVSK